MHKNIFIGHQSDSIKKSFHEFSDIYELSFYETVCFLLVVLFYNILLLIYKNQF